MKSMRFPETPILYTTEERKRERDEERKRGRV
jgi:hypothetical protein